MALLRRTRKTNPDPSQIGGPNGAPGASAPEPEPAPAEPTPPAADAAKEPPAPKGEPPKPPAADPPAPVAEPPAAATSQPAPAATPQPAAAAAPADETHLAGPLEAVIRHRKLVLLTVLLVAGAGIAIGLLRDPVYTAESRIAVGRVDVPAYTLQGVTVGNTTLAASYSRAVAAPAVIDAGAQAARISPAEARERLGASHIPNSTLIRIEAEGESERQAARLANGTADGLINYVTALNVRQQDSAALSRFRSAQRRTERARTRLARVLRNNREGSRAVERARLALTTAQVRSRAVASRVLQATVAPPAENLLQLVVPAATADSDKSSVLQELGLIGLVAGLVLGAALALLRANWRHLRRVGA